MQAVKFASTRDMPREEWLKLRRQGIGGSDAAAILGMSPYKSAYSVWADKMGYLPEQPDNEAMRQGRDLEQYVAERFSEYMQDNGTPKRVVRLNSILRHPEHQWMQANIDRRIVGERAGLECKTSKDLTLRRYSNGEFPEEYYCQCMHYLAVTGWEKWYLAVLIYGTELKVFEIARDEDDIAALIAAESDFWHRYVEGGAQPPVDSMDATTRALNAVWSDEEEGTADCTDPDAMDGYMDVCDQIKRLEAEKQLYANRIRAMIGSCSQVLGASGRATWKSQSKREFEMERFKQDHPEISLDGYYRAKVSRVLRVSRTKDKD